MNDLKIFNNAEFGQIRAMEIDGVPWLVGKDVAIALGYAKPENAIAAPVDEEDKTTTLIQGTGSNYKSKVVIINESGVYSLIFSSKLPSAKKFKRWVTSEVLPSIRKTGSYSLPGAVQVAPAKLQPEVSLTGLARVANTARRAVLDMGGNRWEAGVEVFRIFEYCGLPVPGFAKHYVKLMGDGPFSLDLF